MATFLFASDSLKGTLSSEQTAVLLAQEARKRFPGCVTRSVPMADGGEGTVEALVAACGGDMVEVASVDPLGRPLQASYALLPHGRAVIEVASASGITLLDRSELDPLAASSYGTGLLVRDALDKGCRDISIALGGSATNDGGMGMARALGARFCRQGGAELKGSGSDLGWVSSIDVSSLDPRVAEASFHAMCDVDSPLTGPSGASMMFGPQKGATPATARRLESGMKHYAMVLDDLVGGDVSARAGAGAAGGLGAACMAFLGADLSSGIARVLELVGFDRLLEGVDVCVTGEGHLDSQTARGKVVSGVAAACGRRGVPCVAIVGGCDPEAEPPSGVSAVVPLATGASTLDELLADAKRLYALAAGRTFALLAAGAALEI